MSTCTGKIKQGTGCILYAGSDDHVHDMNHEDFMRHGGLGFGISFDSNDAMMLLHLQRCHDIDHTKAYELIKPDAK